MHLRLRFPGAVPPELVPGSLVFAGTAGPVPLNDWTAWWRWVPGADWRHPEGRARPFHGRARVPVVHVTYEDALPSRDGQARTCPPKRNGSTPLGVGSTAPPFSWGEEFVPKGRGMANTWEGASPGRTSTPAVTAARPRSAGFRRTATACTTWPATSGSGPGARGPKATTRLARRGQPAARPRWNASSRPTGGSPRAGPICVRPPTATGTGRRRGRVTRYAARGAHRVPGASGAAPPPAEGAARELPRRTACRVAMAAQRATLVIAGGQSSGSGEASRRARQGGWVWRADPGHRAEMCRCQRYGRWPG